jgi:hypothetical protein
MKSISRLFLLAMLLAGGWLFASPSMSAQTLGDFQLSYGYNFGLGARKDALSSSKQSAPGKFTIFLSSRLSLRVESSSIKSLKTEGEPRNTGIGDTSFAANFQLLSEDPEKKWPGLALDYSAKIPTASKGLGSGEVDHQILGILSRTFTKRLYGEIDGGVYVSGVAQGTNTKSGLISVIGSSGLGPARGGDFKWSLLEEIDYATAVTGTPTSLTSTLLLSRTLSPKWTLVGGVNAGITPYDPKFGFTFGVKYSGSFRSKRLGR